MPGSDKDEILNAIRRTTEANGGKPLGRRRFEAETGISPWDWGRYWPRFGDAQREAGIEPNALNPAFSADHVIEKYIEIIREIGRLPTVAELRVRRSRDPDFPDRNVFARLGSRNELIGKVLAYCGDRREYGDVVRVIASRAQPPEAMEEESSAVDGEPRTGFVYLIRGHRGEYKLGHTSVVDRRLSELATGSSADLEVIHEIKTDDPLGVEAYWHRRFAARRIKSEWFGLTAADVRAFKRWRRIF